MDKQSSMPRQTQEGDNTEMPSLSCAIDSVLSMEENDKVTTILEQVSELTDLEKYLLYLKLPINGPDEPAKHPPSSMAKRTNDAATWIRNNCVENKDEFVLKQEVYEHYRADTEASGINPLSSGDFGKVIKLVFPKINQRRLGQRGKSKYVYWGLKKKDIDSSCSAEVLPPVLVKEDVDLYALSCQLVCEWASQLLERPFSDIKSLSEFLVSKGLSCGKTAAKFALLSGSTSPPKFLDKERKSPSTKHQERQMLLSCKLQQKEIIREHKQKLMQQQKVKRELQSAKASAAKSAFSPTVCATNGAERGTALFPIAPERSIQQRPSSVQPYIRYVQTCTTSSIQEGTKINGEGTINSAMGPLLGKSSSKIKSRNEIDAQGTSGDHESAECPTQLDKSHTIHAQPKRCHSTSAVEKCSQSLLYGSMDFHGNTIDTCSSSGVMSSSCEISTENCSDIATTPSDSHIIVSSSLEDVPNTGLPQMLLVSHSGATRNITKMLESPAPRTYKDSLIIPQHPKRNGDTISPDRSQVTKRRCMTSLGFPKQQSLEVEMMGKENFDKESVRLRPFSCPVSMDDSEPTTDVKKMKSFLDPLPIETKSCDVISKEKMSVDESRPTSDCNPAAISEKKRGEERRKYRQGLHGKKNSSQYHFVQKPTVINRPVNVLPIASSCPDLQQSVTLAEKSQQQIDPLKPVKSSYFILNSLLSSSCDRLPEPVQTMETSRILPSSFISNTQESAEPSNPTLQSSQLRLITSASYPVENTGILSSLSSRSAFVPVTSHKLQVANSSSIEKDNVINVPSPQKQSTVLNKQKDNEIVVPSSTALTFTTESPSEVNIISKSLRSVVTTAHTLDHNKSVILTNSSVLSTTEGLAPASMKLQKDNIYMSSTCSSSSSSSSSSTLVHSGESTSSGGESAFTTPVPVSSVENIESGKKSNPTVSSKQQTVITTASSTPTSSPIVQCKSSPSTGLSPHAGQGSHSTQTVITASSSNTPPKRASRNRFTPIRPKLGGTSTPSPQKLGGGSMTPSPQKKDMRPVSTILKEQRVKSAQDLLVNLANNYHGEVKLQMPAELLGLSPPGKSKSSDVLVTIGPPSSSSSSHQHSNFQAARSDLSPHFWPVTSAAPPHKEITVVVEPVSQAPSHSVPSPSISSCLISNASAHFLHSIPQTVGLHNLMFPQPLFSPNRVPNSQTHQAPLTSCAGSNTQIIILSPSTACNPSPCLGNSSVMPIIVQDEKGNKYSLDKKSGSAVLPQNLQKLIMSSQLSDTITTSPSKTVLSGSSGLLNISEISGHVVGPDAQGQTYLLVPNSDTISSASTTPVFSFVSQQPSPVLNSPVTTLVTETAAAAQPVVPQASTAKVAQPHATSSSALLSELSQLASSGQNMSGQAVIQHNSGSSAFHKCPSSTQRRTSDTIESVLTGARGIEPDYESSELSGSVSDNQQMNKGSLTDSSMMGNAEQMVDRTLIRNSEVVVRDTTNATKVAESYGEDETYPLKTQGLRKRKASKSHDDEHEDKKRLSSSKDEKEVDDDVFIVNYEDRMGADSGSESTATQVSCRKINTEKGDAVSDDIFSKIVDSKSITVKEAIRRLNEARQNKENKSYVDKNTTASLPKAKSLLTRESSANLEVDTSLCQQPVCDSSLQLFGSSCRPKSVNRIDLTSQSTRCNSVSPYPSGDGSRHSAGDETRSAFDKSIPKVQRSGRRHISLNLESLESDALLDSEPAIDHRLVGDIRDVKFVRSDQKTSVGVAAKAAKPTALLSSSDRNSETKAKAKQLKQPPTNSSRAVRSYQMILTDKKRLDKICSSVTPKESSSHTLSDLADRQIASEPQIDTTQVKCPVNNEGSKPRFPSEQRRSMSCVRDILQRGAVLGKNFSPVVGRNASDESPKQNQMQAKCGASLSSTARGSKASDHPFLAHHLSTSTASVCASASILRSAQRYLPSSKESSDKNSGSTFSHTEAQSSASDNELPGDILDFITESSTRNPCHSGLFLEKSLNSVLDDLVRNGPNDRGQVSSGGQDPVVWRSMSVPNTITDDQCTVWDGAGQKHFERSLEKMQNCSLSSARSQSVVTCENYSGKEADETPRQCFATSALSFSETPWNSQINSCGMVSPCEISEIAHLKELSLQQTSPSLESGVSSSSGTFLSPIGPAKLTRRSSVERSSSGDRSATRTPVESLGSKACTERPPSRIKTPVDRLQTRTPSDRSLVKTPVDKSMTKLPVDRTGRKTPRDPSPGSVDGLSIRDHTTASVLQPSTKTRDPSKASINQPVTKSPSEKVLNALVLESILSQGPVSKLTQQDSVDSMKGDRSLSQTPISDAGYSSVSPSPIMMSIPGLFGECGRRDLTSPATIFMPLRSDSAMSLVNSGRSCDVYENGGSSVKTPLLGFQAASTNVCSVSQTLSRASEEDEQGKQKKTLTEFGCETESTLLQDAIDETLFNSSVIKNSTECGILRSSAQDVSKDTSTSLQDFEKIMSAPLNCIPTPPCSPSSSPQHPSETIQSPLSFSVGLPFPNVLPSHSQQSSHIHNTSVPSHFMPSLTSVTMTNSLATSSSTSISLRTFTSPGKGNSGQNSPTVTIPLNITSSPYGSAHSSFSPHNYNPHPSPPFTPSSQRCMASPRCPTPCSHRSLMSPRCATPCGDSNSAPNRFMPIQTSGILTMSVASTHTYIQPIRPVVTLASLANQNSHNSPVFSKPDDMFAKVPYNRFTQNDSDQAADAHCFTSHNQVSSHGSSFLGSGLLGASNTDLLGATHGSYRNIRSIGLEESTSQGLGSVKTHQKTSEGPESEGSTQPALVLSLTGSIGSVSGQGMKAGWSRDIAGQASSSQIIQGKCDSSTPSLELQQYQNWTKNTSDENAIAPEEEIPPTYEEALSFLTGQSSRTYQDNENSAASVYNEKMPEDQIRSDGNNLGQNFRSSEKANEMLRLVQDTSIIPRNRTGVNVMPSMQQSSRENESELQTLFSMPRESVDYPFSHQLALLSDQSRSDSAEQQDYSQICISHSSTPVQTPSHILQEETITNANSESSLVAMLQTPAFIPGQARKSVKFSAGHSISTPSKPISDLPSANYAGIAPNIDVTKTLMPANQNNSSIPDQTVTSQSRGSAAQQEALMIGFEPQLSKGIESSFPNKDDLDETLDVLKSLDSQYFQLDDNSN